MEVAMKFTCLHKSARKEYKIYTYLNALNNPGVQSYGIPTVYYYGKWNKLIILAMTLLDSSFQKKIEDGELNELDLMILFREFVSIQKIAINSFHPILIIPIFFFLFR